MRKLPPLNSLKAFEACARLRSFTLAAEELLVSQSAVSKQVRALENYLGVRLLYRRPRHLGLTSQGAAMLPALTEVFDRVASLAAQVEGHSSVLHLKASPTFSLRWLIPRLKMFEIMDPTVEVRLSQAWQPVNFAEENYDIGVVCSSELPMYDDAVKTEFILDEDITPAYSPSILANDIPPREPSDLLNFSLLHSTAGWDVWLQWFAQQGVELREGEPAAQQYFEAMDTAIHAAVQGMGIALVNPDFIGDELALGRLVIPFPDRKLEVSGYHLIYPRAVADQHRVRSFKRWLLQAAQSAPLVTSVPQKPLAVTSM